MKRVNLLIIVISLVLIIFGAGLLAWGLKAGASPVVRIGDKNVSGSMDYVTGEVDITEFDELILSASSMDIYIEEGDKYSLTYNCLPEDIPQVEQDGKKLTVKQNVQKGLQVMSFDFNIHSESDYYKITVPKDCAGIQSEIKITSGSVNASNIELNGNVHMTSGEYIMNNVKGKELNLYATSGGFNINGCEFDSLMFDITSGDVNCENNTFKVLKVYETSGDTVFKELTTDDVFLDMTSGSVTMDIKGSEDEYDYTVKATSGDIFIGGNELSGKCSSDKGRAKKIEAKTTSGDVNISFLE